jgi:proteasome accessory factor A
MEPCIKVIGADFELANALETGDSSGSHAGKAAKRLLREIAGYPEQHFWGGTEIEWGRRFLPSCGASAYIDSDHLEINLPEHTRAEDHAAMVYAGLRIAREAQVAAAAKLPEGSRINVTTAVSDGRHSWGHHLNVMVRRELFDDLFLRKPHLVGFLATHLATATLYAGQGQVGAGNDRPACVYQLSQRADWFEQLLGHQTMYSRPLLNMRDEPHAANSLARLHIIYFDRVLCPVANYLMAGATQLILAMAEAGWADPDLLLDGPLEAAHTVSRDLTLKQPLILVGRGRRATAVQVQKELADLAGEFIASGQAGDAVPGAAAIVACWQETLDQLKRRDLAALMRRCDWALKYLLLDRQRARRGLSWQSPELRALDFQYSSLDPEEGLFWQMAQAGQVDAMPTGDRIDRFFHEPPDDTRAYLRAHVLRRFGEHVADIDWSWIRLRLQTHRYWQTTATLAMPDPTGFGRSASDPLLERCSTVQELIDAMGGDAVSADQEPNWRMKYRRTGWDDFGTGVPRMIGPYRW